MLVEFNHNFIFLSIIKCRSVWHASIFTIVRKQYYSKSAKSQLRSLPTKICYG